MTSGKGSSELRPDAEREQPHYEQEGSVRAARGRRLPGSPVLDCVSQTPVGQSPSAVCAGTAPWAIPLEMGFNRARGWLEVLYF